MPRFGAVKTYGRSSKANSASKAFDAAVHKKDESKPSTAMAASTKQKWGARSFTSTRASVAELEAKRKREPKEEEEKEVSEGLGDPFSFDSDDDGPSSPKKTKRGLPVDIDTGKVVIPKNKVATNGNSSKTNATSQNTTTVKNTYSRKANEVNRNTKTNSKTYSKGTTNVLEEVKGREKKDVFSDLTFEDDIFPSTNYSSKKNSGKASESSKSIRKFFISSQRSTGSTDHTYSSSQSQNTEGDLSDHTYSSPTKDKDSDEGFNFDSEEELESGDPEIIFNSPKKRERELKEKMKKTTTATKGKSSRYDSDSQGKERSSSDRNKVKNVCEPAVKNVCEPAVRERSNSSSSVSSNDTTENGHKPAKTYGLGRRLLSKKLSTLEEDTKKKEKKEDPVVRRLLTSPKKVAARYNPRQQWKWFDAEEDQPKNSEGSTTQKQGSSGNTGSSSVFDDFNDEPSIKANPRFKRTIKPAPSPWDDEVSALKVSREHKPLFTVVRNVKQAHECQEHGETQEFEDDILYLMDGLLDNSPLSVRCLSTLNFATKCTMPGFRMHLRAHGTLSKVFSALHDAPKYPQLALCTAALMYMLSRDKLNMDLEKSTLELMLALLSVDSQNKTDLSSPHHKEIRRLKTKIHGICETLNTEGETKQRNIQLELEHVTTGYMAMETLLSLTSKRAGAIFKEELRMLGGLDHLVDTVSDCIKDDDEITIDPSEDMLNRLEKIERCLRVLENVTYMNSENQNYLISYSSSKLFSSLNRALKICENCLPFNQVEEESPGKVDKECPGYLLFSCMLSILRVLLNLTNENDFGSAKAGQQDNLMKTVLKCILQVPKHVPVDKRFDLCVLGLGLLVNMVEHSESNKQQLVSTVTVSPYDALQKTQENMQALQALSKLLVQKLETAQIAEAEQDQHIKTLKQQKNTKNNHRGGQGNNESGHWKESDSGLEWVMLNDDDERPEETEQEEEDEHSDTGSDFDVLPGSQKEDETLTRALNKAGKHMEDSIVSAYISLLIGCVIQNSIDLAEQVRDYLPEGSFDPMVLMLKKFLGFMNLTTGHAGGKKIAHIIEVLEAC